VLVPLTEPLLSVQVSNILKYLFPVPKEDSKRVITFSNQEDFISFRSTSKLIRHDINIKYGVINIEYGIVFHVCVVWMQMIKNVFLCTVLCRHHTYKKTDHKNVALTEVGPRFEMKRKYSL